MTEGRTDGVVILRRGMVEESKHRIHAVVASADGRRVAGVGDARRITFMRSAAKPFQALPLVDDGVMAALDIPARELALACGSHGGEPRHVEGALRLLARAGFGPDALECGPHAPMNPTAARELQHRGETPGRVHNNCSGKHAGMLALAHHLGWDPSGYHQAGHPVQERMARVISQWTGVPRGELLEGADGCGVVCFAVPLESMARAIAGLVAAADRREPGPEAVVSAMTRNPFMVAGSDRLCSELMRATEGRVVAKVGAEGVYVAADRETGLGAALKVDDGARRAAEVALLAIMEQMGAIDSRVLAALKKWNPALVPNTRGEPAAELLAELELMWKDGDGRSRSTIVLPPPTRVLVALSAALAAGDEDAVAETLAEGVGLGMDVEVEECLLQSHLFVGFARSLNGFSHWRRLGRCFVGPIESNTDRSEWMARGESLCREVYGSAYGALRRNVAALHPDMDRWMVEEGYGKVLARTGLSVSLRELCVVAILAVQGAAPQLHSHLRGALRVGCPPEQVVAALTLALTRADPERCRRAWAVWGEVESRFEDGMGPETDQPKVKSQNPVRREENVR